MTALLWIAGTIVLVFLVLFALAVLSVPWRRVYQDKRHEEADDVPMTFRWGDGVAPSRFRIPRERALALVAGTRAFADDRNTLLKIGAKLVGDAARYDGSLSEIRRAGLWDLLSDEEKLAVLAEARDGVVTYLADQTKK